MNQFKRTAERGFTLIELLVVIAIIGVLSSVVLSSLNSARGKGNDAKVKAQLSSMRGAAEIFYSNQLPPSYKGTGYDMCAPAANDPSGLDDYMAGANYPDGVAPTCAATPQSYAITHALPFAGGYWCVDSTGDSRQVTGPLTAGDYTCQ